MTSSHRPHVQTVRLTEAQHVLVHERMHREPGMTWQKLLASCVNAYIRGELTVSPRGEVSIGDDTTLADAAAALVARPAEGPAISYEDDEDAVDLEDLKAMTDEEALTFELTLSEGAISYDEAGAISLADLEGVDDEPATIGTRELAALAEERTGKPVHLKLLREFLREEFPQGEPGPGARYRWDRHDPEVELILELVGDGALDDLRDRRLEAVKGSR